MKIFIAIPALNEFENIPELLKDLKAQTVTDFKVFVCINNPDEWWNDPVKRIKCENNVKTMQMLNLEQRLDLTIIDRFSPGKGWKGRQRGVGYARKELFEAIDRIADDEDIVISLDADTRIRPGFISSGRKQFISHKKAMLLTNPYYHNLTGNDAHDRAILRYELYMRYYLINLLLIDSPYAFSALGSAISFSVKGYRKISGITPKEAGEDFYFVNRMKKAGEILIWNDEAVYPSARESDRVPFGTGPAVIKGKSGDWDSYPFYDKEGFERIGETCKLFPKLFKADCETPIDEFIQRSFGENIWEPLRKNFKTEKLFVRACHEKIDGLRILQILRYYQIGDSLKNFINFSVNELEMPIKKDFLFDKTSVVEIDAVRNEYFRIESELRKKTRSL
ncbi:MAG TPA: hypothetical protein PLK90_00885 [Clostridiales bacterium]|nr:hypothetical protein [Clostridiales bacterium]HQP68931.1 hypothetical protein [Clostridiales bacterium]